MFAPSGYLRGAVDLFSIFVIFPVVIAIGARLQPTGWWAYVSAMLGAATYAVFAVHVPMLNLLAAMLDAYTIQPSFLLGFGFLVGLAALAMLLDLFYDRPVRAWLSARLRKPARQAHPLPT